jgi:hypothetical protein
MARPRPEKKDQPGMPAERRVFPMDLQIGERLADETGEWEVIGRPYTTSAGRDASAFRGSASPMSPRSGAGARTSA